MQSLANTHRRSIVRSNRFQFAELGPSPMPMHLCCSSPDGKPVMSFQRPKMNGVRGLDFERGSVMRLQNCMLELVKDSVSIRFRHE